MKTLLSVATIALLCAGCAGGGSTGGTATDTPGSSGPTPSAAHSAGGDCARTAVDGSTKDAALQEIAQTMYDSLSCGAAQTLDEQLDAAATAAQAQLKKEGIDRKVTKAAGGMTLALTHDSSGCQILVVDSVDSKSLTCLDL
ncbi:MAG: hypothetical protein U0R64_06605 [Candidatus Nanopelagicales bacterium]